MWRSPMFLFLSMVVVAHATCYYQNATLIALQGNRKMLSTNPQTAGVVKSYTVADITLSISASGSLIIVQNSNGTAIQLWSSASGQRNCTPECVLSSQGDGNIVAYDGHGQGYWGTSTCMTSEGPGCSGMPQQIILSAYRPYFFTPDSTCNVTWQLPGAAQRQGAVVTSFSTVFGPVAPKPLNTFYNSFGVNTHISQGQDYRAIIDQAKYVGASTIRDGAVKEVIAVGQAGIKLNLGIGGAANRSVIQQIVAAIASIHNQSNAVVSVEGANELNNQPFTYNGVSPSSSCAGYAQYQRDVYSTVKNNNILKASGVVVYDLTAGNEGMDCAAQGLLKLDSMADYANIHSYTYQYPIVTPGGDTFSAGMDNDYPGWNQQTPRVITETGAHTYISASGEGVDELTHSKLVVNCLMNGIADGYSKVFIYQLLDQRWDGYEGSESYFGIFRNNNTAKPAAVVLNQMSQLLQNSNISASATLSNLSFSLIGINQNVRYQLFQSQARGSNVYWLAVWQNLAVWNPNKNTPVQNPTLPITLSLGSVVANLTVYNPYSKVNLPSAGSPLVVKSAVANKIQLDLPDYLQFIQISLTQGGPSVKSTGPDTSGQDANPAVGGAEVHKAVIALAIMAGAYVHVFQN